MIRLLQIFFAHSLRYWMRHRLLAVLNIGGIALGVAVFISIQVINHSALTSFRASLDVVAGRANFTVRGEGLRFPETVYDEVLKAPHVESATPVVEQVCLLTDYPGQYLHVLGVDLFSNRPFSTYTLIDGKLDPDNMIAFMTEPRHVAIAEDLAHRLSLKPGDHLRINAAGKPEELIIHSVLRFSEDTPGADEHLAVMDIATAQEVFDLVGKLSRVDVIIKSGPGQSLNAAVQETRDFLTPRLPAYVEAGSPERRTSQVETMLGAFQLNLTALSLIALVVGMFLIYNTVATAVVKRRAEIGLLRALGLDRTGVMALFIGEALVLGLIGLVLGVAGGAWIATLMVGAVSSTITSLYILLNIREIFLSPVSVLLGAGAAAVAVVAAAWLPAWEASRVAPVEALSLGTLRDEAERSTGRWTWLALACFGMMGIVSAACRWWGFPAWCSFGAAFFALIGAAFLVPALSRWMSRLYGGKSVTTRLAFQHFGRSLHRNSVTIAALVTAMAMLLGVSLMIHSFRETVHGWLERSIKADLFVAPASSLVVGVQETLPPSVVTKTCAMPGIADTALYRELSMVLDGKTVKLSAVDFGVLARHNPLSYVASETGNPLATAAGKEQVIISEPFARKFRVKVGDSLELPAGSQRRTFHITAIFKDYTTERGVVLIDQPVYARLWQDPAATSVAVFLVRPETVRDFQQELRKVIGGEGEFLIYSNRQVREEALHIFDQTFSVTYLLRWIAFMVAGLGVFLSLTILVAEREREIGLLRAAGASRGQIMRIIGTEAVLIAVAGIILGLPAGFLLAAILSYVINVAFFGWTIDWSTPWSVVLQTPWWVLLAALLAAAWPAWKAARTDIAVAVKSE